MKEINIAVIGSGSTYCPELVDGLIKRASSLHIKRLTLMDIDERKRNIVGELCIRMLKKAGIFCEVVLTDDLDQALKDADFVVTQIRVGKLPARHLDETIPVKYGLLGQETTGIGGFFKALRTIPVMQNITNRMKELCPDAWLINFTNPAGIMTEYVLNYTDIHSIGLCNVPINMIDDVRQQTSPDANVLYLGLNHLSWIPSVVTKDGEQIDHLLSEGFSAKAMANIKDDGFDPQWLRNIRAIPSSYLQYFYCRDKKMEHLKQEEKSRAQVCMEIEEQLLKLYSDPSVDEKPALLDKRGGHKYSLAAVSLIDSIANDKQDDHVVNIKNNGALSFMKDDDVVEITAKIGKNGAVPYPVDEFHNRHIITMMQTVKAYEKLTVEAALTGSDELALQALMLHPLLGDYERTKACFEEMKQAHRAYLPQFFKD
jgi:6-phospho-beta-glucosidase